MILKTSQLTKDFGGNKGVFDLTLELNPGEIVGFLGPNGVGKSTTLGMLSGLIIPSKGSFEVFDQPVNHLKLHRFNPNIGILMSDVAFDPDLKVKQIFKQSQDLLGKKLDKTWQDLAKYLDLDLEKKFSSLSLGNKKKVGLVQAIMHKPKLLIMDEPTSGLDPLIQQKFQSLVSQMAKNGTGVILSSHALTEVESICTRIIMIKNGKIILQDATKNIKEQALKIFILPAVTPLIEANLKLLDGVVKIQTGPNETKLWTTKRAPVLLYLSQRAITEFYLERATLEEMFLQFYR